MIRLEGDRGRLSRDGTYPTAPVGPTRRNKDNSIRAMGPKQAGLRQSLCDPVGCPRPADPLGEYS